MGRPRAEMGLLDDALPRWALELSCRSAGMGGRRGGMPMLRVKRMRARVEPPLARAEMIRRRAEPARHPAEMSIHLQRYH